MYRARYIYIYSYGAPAPSHTSAFARYLRDNSIFHRSAHTRCLENTPEELPGDVGSGARVRERTGQQRLCAHTASLHLAGTCVRLCVQIRAMRSLSGMNLARVCVIADREFALGKCEKLICGEFRELILFMNY